MRLELQEKQASDIYALADLAMKYEEQSVLRSMVLDLSLKMCETISVISQHQASVIAAHSDAEAVRDMIARDDAAVHADELVNTLRSQKVQHFVNEVRHIVRVHIQF